MAVKYKDYYKILGVDRSATDQEIRAAYRRLARQYHPDLQTGEAKTEAEEKFKEINEAYEVLSDPEKRAKYDQLGAQWREGMDFTPPPGFEGVRFYGDIGDLGDFSDFFRLIFGGMGFGPAGATTTRRRWARRGADVEAGVELTLEEAYRGAKKALVLTGREGCEQCGGTGLAGNQPCPICGGSGMKVRSQTIEVTIPQGVREGSRIRLKGQGEPGIGGAPKGDLFLRVRLLPHSVFTLDGDDITVEVPVYPWEAALGAQVEVPTLDGPVRLKVPPGSQSGHLLRLRGKGFPKDGGRGDQYVRLEVVLPTNLTEEDQRLLEQLAASHPENPRDELLRRR